jgi:aminoglycoside 3-N-acetyltransferase
MSSSKDAVTQQLIEDGLRELGVGPEAIVVAHSSLRSFGWVEGGEDAVIDALLAVVGPTGTVCMPTLTYGYYGPRRPPPPFDPRSVPCIVGRIPERFRQRADVFRSLHPTHSIAGTGARAEEILRDHERSPTPCGPDSPWGRIAEAGGSVVMVGVGTSYCTLFHGPEEQAEPSKRCGRPTPCRLVTNGSEKTAWLRLHKAYRGAVSNRAAMEGVLESEGLLQRTHVGKATLLRIDAYGLWQLSLTLLRTHPSRPIDKASALTRRLIRRGISARRGG